LLAWCLTFAGLLIHFWKRSVSLLTPPTLAVDRDEEGHQQG
jgi:hypothetical protein